MATSRRLFLAGAGATALSAMSAAARADDIIRNIIESPRRGNWDTEFDARATQAGRVASNLPIFNPETVAHVERAIVQ